MNIIIKILNKYKLNNTYRYTATDKYNNIYIFEDGNSLSYNQYYLCNIIDYTKQIYNRIVVFVKNYVMNSVQVINNRFIYENKLIKSDEVELSHIEKKLLELNKKIKKIENIGYNNYRNNLIDKLNIYNI